MDNIQNFKKQDLFFPVFLRIYNEPCLVVGGGEVALRKIKTLIPYKPKLTVVSPSVHEKIANYSKKEKLIWIKREFILEDLEGKILVIAATNNVTLNQFISKEAQERNILCNVVDQPNLCSFIIPSIYKKGRLTIAVSTGGTSPALAKKIKEELNQYYGDGYELALDILHCLRMILPQVEKDQPKRSLLYSKLVRSNFIDLCKAQDFQKIEEKIFEICGLREFLARFYSEISNRRPIKNQMDKTTD
jgi:precorrin-2 dehydrogenase/sirohydrochlorin ferrochelatase